jgi:solute carrier family 45, member 1/2/4
VQSPERIRGSFHLPAVEEDGEGSRSRSRSRNRSKKGKPERMSMLKMMALTVSMGGSQIAWTVSVAGRVKLTPES